MERKLAQLLSEVSTRRRMWRRATVAAGNSMVQVWLRSLKGCVCVCVAGETGKERELSSKNRLSFHANGKCQEKIQLNRRVALSGSR